MSEAINSFLLGFPALFSIINPFNGALAFRSMTLRLDEQEREQLARLTAIYSLAVMLIALWVGSFVLAFFGITVAGLRVSGGLVIALNAWRLLTAPETDETSADVGRPANAKELAMVPLTIPLTAGPGTISVAIALGSEHPTLDAAEIPFFSGMTVAAVGMAFVIWLSYRWADRIAQRLGPVASRTLTRLVGFLLLCIGVQILITGVVNILAPLLAAR
jgi:multiple antibiotic resistance protein